jgi:hypothetical protein
MLLDLLTGRRSRDEVANWAGTWVYEPFPAVEDDLVWSTLQELVGADLKISSSEYLHNEADFHEWLDRVEIEDP